MTTRGSQDPGLLAIDTVTTWPWPYSSDPFRDPKPCIWQNFHMLRKPGLLISLPHANNSRTCCEGRGSIPQLQTKPQSLMSSSSPHDKLCRFHVVLYSFNAR